MMGATRSINAVLALNCRYLYCDNFFHLLSFNIYINISLIYLTTELFCFGIKNLF